ncbi:MAG: helix-turn-helix domain-containing protein [Novosphingobium sp.]
MTTKIAYTIKEASAACGISRTTIYGLIKDGELAPVKIGARTLIAHADIEALIERKRTA